MAETKVGPPLKLLAIDDDPHSLETTRDLLERENLQVVTAADSETGLRLFRQTRPRIVILDLLLPGMDGLQVLDEIIATDPGTDVVLVTSQYSTESAVEAIKRGACDYLVKPVPPEKLRQRIASLIAEAETRRKTLDLESELADVLQVEEMIGRSPLMLELFARIRRVAPHFRTVLVTGPTGSGKELVAIALHRLSPVATRPFAICNCSALVQTLLECELFGYVKGAFTGALQDKIGVFEYANGGTVFLDEIGEMPLTAQAKLLRVLQNQEVQRVGSPVLRKVDVRVIAATNRNLRAMVEAGSFRDDLFYRLSMVQLEVPRLADRREDIHLLQRHFIAKFAARYGKDIKGITRRAQAILARHSWPGNVRELENVIGNACMMMEGNVIDVHDLPPSLTQNARRLLPEEGDLLSFEALQRHHLLHVLEHVGGNKARAAEILGISRATIYEMLARMKGVPTPERRREPNSATRG
jgi:DNA-binding NtrC family response regulator